MEHQHQNRTGAVCVEAVNVNSWLVHAVDRAEGTMDEKKEEEKADR